MEQVVNSASFSYKVFLLSMAQVVINQDVETGKTKRTSNTFCVETEINE